MKRLFPIIAVIVSASLAGCGAAHRAYLAASYKIVRNTTSSMLPTIKEGQLVAIDMDYYQKHPVKRFDIVLIRDPRGAKTPDGQDTFYFKRIIGLGGETIEIQDGTIFINDSPLAETFSFLPDQPRVDFDAYKIPEGEFFVLGDNRSNSADSRYWQPPSIGRNLIRAKVVEIIAD